MRIIFCILLIGFAASCGRRGSDPSEKIITVSIAPFKFFVTEIAGDDFKVNIMVPSGADPHIYEPVPEQITKLRKSVAYISNGYLGFEMIWLADFYEANNRMKRLSLSDVIDPLVSDHHDTGSHVEGADPHYWVSPKCGLEIAVSVRDLLCELNPSQRNKYYANCQRLLLKINNLDIRAEALFSGLRNRTFMIFHPNLGYLARDYDLNEISLEYEGKEPSPSRMKELIDLSRREKLKIIFIQREFDIKNARSIADEIGAELKIIDPLSEDWLGTITYIVDEVFKSCNGI